MSRRLNLDRIYLDQAMSSTRAGDRVFTAAYTPYGIHRLDSRYIRRIQSGHGSKAKLRAEIKANPHLHKTIKNNLIGNLDRLFDRYKRCPAMTYIPPGSVVMVKDCEFDRRVAPLYASDLVDGKLPENRPSDMLSFHVGRLGYVEWYEDSGNLSVCLRSGRVGRDGLIEEGLGQYFVHERATFRHDELEVLWESPYHES